MWKLAAIFASAVVLAHLPDRPDLNAWAMGLKDNSNVPCCDGSDAVPLRDPDWRTNEAGNFEVLIEGEWVEVPTRAVVKDPNRYGQALIWYFRGTSGIYIRCFLPGAGA